MTTAARCVLPDEREDPHNRLLDAFEAQVAAAVALGLEPQLRARLARLLPEPARPEPAPAPARPRDSEHELLLTQVLVVCRQMEGYRLPGEQHAAIARLKCWIIDRLEEARQCAP